MMTKHLNELVPIKAKQLNESVVVSSNNKYMKEKLSCNDVSSEQHESIQNDQNEEVDNATRVTLTSDKNIEIEHKRNNDTYTLEKSVEEAANDVNSAGNAILPKWFPSLQHNIVRHYSCTNTPPKQQEQQEEYYRKESKEEFCTSLETQKESEKVSSDGAKDAEHMESSNEQKLTIINNCRNSSNNNNAKKVNIVSASGETREANGKNVNASANVNTDINSVVEKEELLRFRRREVHLLRELRDRTLALQEAQRTIRELQALLAEREERTTIAVEETLRRFPCLTSAQRQLVSFDSFLTPMITRADVLHPKYEKENLEMLESTPYMSGTKGSARERRYNNQERMKNAVNAFVNRTFKENSKSVKDINVEACSKEYMRECGNHDSDRTNKYSKIEPRLYQLSGNQNVAKHTQHDEANDTKATMECMTGIREQDDKYKRSRNFLQPKCLSANTNTTITTTTTTTNTETTTSFEESSSSSLPSQNSEIITTSQTSSSLSSWPNNIAVCKNKNNDTSKHNNKELKNSITLLQEQLGNKRYLINALRKRKVQNDMIAFSAPTSTTSMNNAINFEKAANDFLTEEETSRKCLSLTDNTVNVAPEVKRIKEFILPSRKENSSATYTLQPFYGYSLKSQTDSAKENSVDSIEENTDSANNDYEM